MDGILNMDKPAGITSAGALNRIKRLVPKGTKIGHAGTLDPFATGVLLVLVGRATKCCERLMGAAKQYEATMKFDATTSTDDLDSPEQPYPSEHPIQPIPRQQIEAVLPRFIGSIEQRPPAFSAMKVKGRRAYDLARRGMTVNLEPRTVQIHSIELLQYAWPFLELRIDCGRGTYIRSIARELGEALDVGGFLMALRRTRIGDFFASDAVSLETLEKDGIQKHLKLMSFP